VGDVRRAGRDQAYWRAMTEFTKSIAQQIAHLA
jgi:hypothetical protein